ncbi:unnamed protein product [Nesidiocoris tenuis]|uniref:rhomboid protease n=1 Tax=Nesidiocoris tenuis TaxID=355587 RepID=A0A6H5FXS6_9HEMI|nr:unnamed protein product [Nesidiocoris tenuis]
MALSRSVLIFSASWRTILKTEPTKCRGCRNFSLGRGRQWSKSDKTPDPLGNRIEEIKLESGPLSASSLVKPAIFTVAFSSASLAGAVIWQFENLRARRLTQTSSQWFSNRAYKVGQWRKQANNWWNSLTEGEKVFFPICLVNGLVFCAWRVPAFQTTMARYFFSNVAAKKNCLPMILSAFSHYSPLHILANMYVLHSFSSGAAFMMGKEQFVGFYMAAAAVSSLASYTFRVALSKPGVSLGASGAIMGVLAYACVKNPDSLLHIILLPMFTFKAGVALKAVMAFDAAGILFGFKLFDHAAHLGGALFGVFWAEYGNSCMQYQRQHLLPIWHKIRTGKTT